jgi:hypothetical protein
MHRVISLTGTAGHLLALLGAVDPLEGSVVVVIGCALVALHAWLTGVPRALLAYRTAVAVMAGLGVAALWGISALGGFGGEEGVAGAWALLVLPYPAALVALFSGPAAPRWVAWGGCAVGGLRGDRRRDRAAPAAARGQPGRHRGAGGQPRAGVARGVRGAHGVAKAWLSRGVLKAGRRQPARRTAWQAAQSGVR